MPQYLSGFSWISDDPWFNRHMERVNAASVYPSQEAYNSSDKRPGWYGEGTGYPEKPSVVMFVSFQSAAEQQSNRLDYVRQYVDHPSWATSANWQSAYSPAPRWRIDHM